jgi:hypothetical protein
VWLRLGPHRFRAKSALRVAVAEQPPEDFADEDLIEAGSGGRYHVLHTNSRDEGLEWFLLSGDLYVRPRYGQFARRRPEEGEADRVRDDAYGALGAHYEVLGRFMGARTEGRVPVGGRDAVHLVLAPVPSPRPATPETDPARAWRETVTLQTLAGTLDVDMRTGVVLTAALKASYTFRRGDRVATVDLDYQGALEPGVEPALAAPEHVPAPRRTRYHVERQQLLDGLAPPAAGAP